MEQEKVFQPIEGETKEEQKSIDLADVISFEVRSIEIPVSEYRDLIGMKAKLDTVIRFSANHDNYDTSKFFKSVFDVEILQATTVVRIKEDDE